MSFIWATHDVTSQNRIRGLFRAIFDIENDMDFALHIPPSNQTINHLNNREGDVDGPDVDDLRFDMRGDVSSEWNQRVFQILLEALNAEKASWGLPNLPDVYFKDLISEKFLRVRAYWRNAQHKTRDDGKMETWDEVESRLLHEQEIKGKSARKNERRRNVSNHIVVRHTFTYAIKEI